MKHETEHSTSWRAALWLTARQLRSRPLTVALLGCLTVALAGCSGGLSAQSSCKDFLNASQTDQVQAIDKVAGQEDAPDATTPLGMPNVSYLCTGDPNQTLGWAVRQTH